MRDTKKSLREKKNEPPWNRIMVNRSRNSVFSRLIVSMLMFLLVMTICVTIWLNEIVTGNHRVQIGHSMLARMEAVSGTVDQALQDMVMTTEQLAWDPDLVHYMMIPFYYKEGTTEAHTQDYRILNRLKNVQASSTLVRRVLFYSPISGRLYQSNSYAIPKAEDTFDWKLLCSDPEESAITPLFRNSRVHTESVLYMDGKGTYIVTKLDIGNHIGTLVFDLDPTGWAEFLRAENPEMMLYVYDKEGTPRFSVEGSFPMDSVSTEGRIWLTNENVEKWYAFRSADYYLYQSALTGWRYISPINMASLRLNVADLLFAFLPMAILLILFGVAITNQIRREIYRPINHLMNQLGGRAGGTQNEFDYLETVYSDAREQQRQLRTVLSQVTPQVQESVIRGILFGRQSDPEVVKETLEGIASPITVKGHFVVCMCQLQRGTDRSISRKEWNLYYISLQNIAAGLSNEYYQVTAVRVDEETIALALCFREDSTKEDVEKILSELREDLCGRIEDMPYTLMIENGQIYTRVTELRESLMDAADRLRYQRYMQADDAETGDIADPIIAAEENQRLFDLRERCRELIQLASVEEKNKACDAAIRVVDQCVEECTSLEQLIHECGYFINELIEQLIKYPLTEEDQEKMSAYSKEDLLHTFTEKDSVRRYVTSRCVEIMQMICGYARRNRNKYVNLAREYIAANYSDSNLSLNDVAEHCGITASYLSELFNEVTGEKFTAYLAKYRVEKARQLQNATRLTVKQIGFQCGFNSSQNFIRVYKKYTGMTPGQYKSE